jgi:large subunit ribosomal protein L32
MGALPKRRRAKSSQGKRRTINLTLSRLDYCPQCHSPKPSHRVCPVCGSYGGREVIEIKSPKKKGG